VNWNEEGHRWSWRMKLRDKEAHTRFFVTPREDNITKEIMQVEIFFNIVYYSIFA
jgi:hypothetical protein